MRTLGRRLPLMAALIMLCSLTSSGKAGPGGCGNSPWMTAFAFEQITVSTTAIGFTQATAFPDGQQGAAMAVFTVETADVRYRADGPVPTAAVGDRIAAAGTATACGPAALKRTRFIREDAADATVSVTYYREGDQ